MLTGLIVGGKSTGRVYAHGGAVVDGVTTVVPYLVTNRVDMGTMWEDLIIQGILVSVSANCTMSFKLVPVVDDVRYDGISARDCSIPFTATGDGLTAMPLTKIAYLGLAATLTDSAGVALSTSALRGNWFQFEIWGTSALGNDIEGQPGVCFLNGMELEYVLLQSQTPRVAPTGGTTPGTGTPGYTRTITGW